MAFLNLFKPSFSRTYPDQEWPNAAKVPDLYGKTAIVLGANQGIGYSIALELARKRATVFVTARTVEKGKRAAESIKKQLEQDGVFGAHVAPLVVVLEDLHESNSKLDILVNNAGMIDNDFHLTTDSIERTFAVGYISHYVFTTALMPALAPGARIVNVSSYAQVNAKIIMDVELINDPNGELNSWLKRYIHTKAAQVMFTRALQERVGTSVFVNVCHPGQISTGLNRSITAPETGIQAYIIRFGMWMWDLPTDIGALTPLYLATSPEVEKKCIKGKYFVPVAHQSMKLINPAALNHELVDKFWTWTESLAKQKIGVYFFV